MARIDSNVITTQVATKIYTLSSRPTGVNSPERLTVYVTGAFNGSTATLTCSIDGGTTKIPVKDRFNAAVVFTANGYFELDMIGRVSNPVLQKPVELYLTTTVANPTGITAVVLDLN